MSLNLRQLETFLWVATLGSFRKTAERLYTTQPAISARIANLEDTLGTKLFEREPGAIRLTAKGQELLPYAEKVLRMTDTLREKAGDPSRLAGVLRLGVSETIVHTLLPAFLARLHENFHEVDVEITVEATVNLRNELVSRSLDLAFLMGPVSEYSIENLDLAAFPLSWIASPELGVPTDRAVPLDELVSFPLLTYARNTRLYAELKNQVGERCDGPARIFPSSSLAANLRMTMDGIGIGSLPKRMVERELDAGILVEVSCPWKPADLKFTASYASEPFNPIAEQAAAMACRIAVESGYND